MSTHEAASPGCARGCCATPAQHYRSISISAAATPTRRPDAVRIDATEARWHKDMPAYKALRDQGIQPPRIDGCHDLAQRAELRQEVERGVVLDAKQRTQAAALLKDMA